MKIVELGLERVVLEGRERGLSLRVIAERASARAGQPVSQDVISKSPGNINVLLGRLVESGVLYRIRKGQYEYTAPKFRDFLLRRTKASVPTQPAVQGNSPRESG